MAIGVSVLCARVKVEEKWLIQALAAAGVPARPLPPTGAPLPIGPGPVPSGPLAADAVSGVAAELFEATGVIVDRCTDRTVAAAVIPALRAMGQRVIDAGLAATGDRLAIASALVSAGIPRPATLLATSEDAGLAAVAQLGFPATLLPLDPGEPEIPFCDRDIAEAVLEHRAVLGSGASTVSLVQGGACAGSRVDVLVVDGRAITAADAESATLAEMAAGALGASVIGVSLARTERGLVVWDVSAVPAFREQITVHGPAIAAALLNLIATDCESPKNADDAVQLLLMGELAGGVSARREVANDVVLSA